MLMGWQCHALIPVSQTPSLTFKGVKQTLPYLLLNPNFGG
jgi:hypothetical protein